MRDGERKESGVTKWERSPNLKCCHLSGLYGFTAIFMYTVSSMTYVYSPIVTLLMICAKYRARFIYSTCDLCPSIKQRAYSASPALSDREWVTGTFADGCAAVVLVKWRLK